MLYFKHQNIRYSSCLVPVRFRAEKRSAQASAHPLSQAQGGLFCDRVCVRVFVCLTRCECLLLEKPLYFCVVFVFLSLENYFGLGTTIVNGKTDHPVSLRSGIKSFKHFQRDEYFDCAFDLFASCFRRLSPG